MPKFTAALKELNTLHEFHTQRYPGFLDKEEVNVLTSVLLEDALADIEYARQTAQSRSNSIILTDADTPSEPTEVETETTESDVDLDSAIAALNGIVDLLSDQIEELEDENEEEVEEEEVVSFEPDFDLDEPADIQSPAQPNPDQFEADMDNFRHLPTQNIPYTLADGCTVNFGLTIIGGVPFIITSLDQFVAFGDDLAYGGQ